MSPLEKNRQRASELLACFSQPRGLDLHVIAKHQFLGTRMEVDLLVHVGQTGAENPTLWRSAVGAVVLPILYISCFETHSDEVEQPTVVDVSG